MAFKTGTDSSGKSYTEVWEGSPGAAAHAAKFDENGLTIPSGKTLTATASAIATGTASTSYQAPLIIVGNADGATARTAGLARAPDVVGATTNVAGCDYVVGGGVGHGNGTPGNVVVKVAPAASSGDNPQTRQTVATFAATTITLADAVNLVLNATTGTKIGTATTQKIGFWNAAPAAQPAAQADAAGGATVDAEARTALNGLLAKLRTIGLIAT